MLSERLFDYLRTSLGAEESLEASGESEVTIGNNRTLVCIESGRGRKISIRVDLPDIGPTDVFVLKRLSDKSERLIISTIDRSGKAFDNPHNVFANVAYGESGNRAYLTAPRWENNIIIKAEIQAELEKQGCPKYEDVGDQTIDFIITAHRFLTFIEQNKLEQLSKIPIGELIVLPQENVRDWRPSNLTETPLSLTSLNST